MIINFDDYLSLTDDEIEKLSDYLENMKILRKREYNKIIVNRDAQLLQKYLNEHDNNLNRELSTSKMFQPLYPKDLDFLKVVMKSNQWNSDFKQKALMYIFESVFTHPELIEFFLKEDKESLIDYIKKGTYFENLTKKGAETLFKRNLINFQDDTIKKYFINNPHEILVLTAIEKAKLKLTTREVELLFGNVVLSFSQNTLKIS